MNRVQIEDCQLLGRLDFIDWNELKNSRILITGSTGLIGSNLVNALAYNSQKKGLDIGLILPVRNVEAAEKLFDWTDAEIFSYELGAELKIEEPVDYIVHLASPTNSSFFTEKPANTMLDNIEGTRALLDWAKLHPVKKFVSLSSMEVYGFPKKGKITKESDLGSFDTMNTRNSYPIAKITCEALCNSYYSQYGVPTVIIRATQTFGPGVKYNDGRVFAQFMRCVVENRDIVLNTTGETERAYLYTADAVSSILLCLMKAEPGQAYSVANPETYCSIFTMAQTVAKEISKDTIKVKIDVVDNIEKMGFAKTLYMNLDIEKVTELGWKPLTDLKTMFERMIRSVTNNE